MLKREAVHEAVLNVMGTHTCNEDPRVEEDITDAIMDLLPDAEALGRAARHEVLEDQTYNFKQDDEELGRAIWKALDK